ncbi:MAG: hypothetical protein M1820_004530 [Bogoriella megaspora]|nr:MAG: hypothetical protein M1820_004530 [Bogoriella megaspora]
MQLVLAFFTSAFLASRAGAAPTFDLSISFSSPDLNSAVQNKLDDPAFLGLDNYVPLKERACLKDENSQEPQARFGIRCGGEVVGCSGEVAPSWNYTEQEMQAAASDAARYLASGSRTYGVNLDHLVEVTPMHWHTWFGRGSTYERKTRDLAKLEHVPSLCRNAYLYMYPILRHHSECGWGAPFERARGIASWDRVVIASNLRHDEPDFILGKAEIKACTVLSARTTGTAGEFGLCSPYEISSADQVLDHDAELKA